MSPSSDQPRRAPLPRQLAPMKAVAGELPTDEVGWVYEIKWDGMRAVAFVDEHGLRLQSSNQADVTAAFPELAGLPDQLGGRTAVLDGEIVAFDGAGRPDFGRLQHRMHMTDPAEAAQRAREVPVVYELFDLLHLDGIDLTDRPFGERRRLLELLVGPGPSWQVPAVHHGGGRDLLEAAAERGLEGLVAKREEAPYQPGKRSSTWRKVKIRRRQELVVGGWTEGEGTRATRLGSLLVGHYENQPEGEASEEPRLRFAGRVGTGFTERELARLGGLLAELATDRCPFVPPPGPAEAGPAHWCRPELVVEVAFAEWTADGRLRHPSYLGQRIDKPPTGVVREPG